MKILFSEQRLCTCCMKEHKIDTVEIKEKITFKVSVLIIMLYMSIVHILMNYQKQRL